MWLHHFSPLQSPDHFDPLAFVAAFLKIPEEYEESKSSS
jgi:hypothetical protein